MKKTFKSTKSMSLILCLACVCMMGVSVSGAVWPAADRPGSEVRLDVENIMQYPELPNGCEITSLAIALQYYGFDIDKLELAKNYLYTKDFTYKNGKRYGPDPEEAYVGDPSRWDGWYCWAGPIAEAANAYLVTASLADLAVNIADLAATDVTGLEFSKIEGYIDAGVPVIAWVTLDWNSPTPNGNSAWRLEDGSWYIPYTNVHCLVITGYSANWIYVANPLSSTSRIDRNLFERVFEQVGSRAVVITEE